MMLVHWLELLLFILLAAVKFAVVVPVYIIKNNLTFFEGLAFSVFSGTLGIIFFIGVSDVLLRFIQWISERFQIRKKKKNTFSKRNRMLVRVMKSYGLIGISFLSPIILSIPVGTFIALRYYKDKKQVFIYLWLGVLFWSLIFSGFSSVIIKILNSLHVA
jgi:hypothetical protein